MDAGTMIKKFHVALFINIGTDSVPVWKRIKKSTDNTISMNPEMLNFDFIDQEAPTQEVDRYAVALSQPLTMYKGEDDFEFFFDKFFNQAVGADAHVQGLVVFYSHQTAANTYKAWKADCVLAIDNMNPVASTITANINFNGTTDKGTAAVTAGVPVFTGTVSAEFVMTFNAQVSAVDEPGATITCNGVTKLTDANGEATFTLVDGQTYAVGVTNGTEEASAVFEADTATATMTLAMA